jgi:CRISPR-associated protein Csm1
MEIKKEIVDTSKNLILIKGDISGIQEFIFNVKSDGAAKSLKAKSFFVKAISIISVRYLFREFGVHEKDQENCTISFSGGNFFILVPDKIEKEQIFAKYKRESVTSLSKVGLNVILTHIKMDSSMEYGKKLTELNRISKIEKYKLFNKSGYNEVFEPFQSENDSNIDFGKFSLRGKKSFNLKPVTDNKLYILNSTIRYLRYELSLSGNEPANRILSLNNLDTFYPVNEMGQIATFEDIAGPMGKTKKLGILKIDVDNLGEIFQQLTSSDEHKRLSEKFRHFFEDELYDLVNGKYYKCVYSIISGGDDCFFVGAWDAIIDLAIEINSKFTSLFKSSPSVQGGNIITLCAGITIVHPTFPVVRFAEMVEDALLQAKMKDPSKNRLSIFNTVIKWEDWDNIMDIKQKIENFVPKHAKSLLMNARKAIINNDHLDKIELSDFWELAYHLRGIKNAGKNHELNEILKVYEKYLNKSIEEPERDQRYRSFFPIAARLVELETRI